MAAPTPSYTAATPAPPVIRATSSATSAWSYRITSDAPDSRASAAFSSVEVVAMTVAPRRAASCTISAPVPPAAACTSTVSPSWTG